MKKNWIVAAAFGMFAITGYQALSALQLPISTVVKADGFKKKSDGTWAGKMDGKMYWYKIDTDAKLWWSTDGKKWAAVENGMWADKDGKWLKIGEQKLWWSADMGKTWSEVPDWKWEGPDGEWYKFDKDWNLWINKA